MPKFEWTPEQVYEQLWEWIEKNHDKEKIVAYISTKETKEIRSLSQNATFYKLFTDIGNHLWEKKDDVHDMLLAWVFGTRTVTIWKIVKEVNIEKHTSKLDKEQGIRFIDTILKFVERESMPITITSREIQSLHDSYK